VRRARRIAAGIALGVVLGLLPLVHYRCAAGHHAATTKGGSHAHHAH
jgi:hypothetical protein